MGPRGVLHGRARRRRRLSRRDLAGEDRDRGVGGCGADVGSELELAGLRPLLDTRAELFCPELNGGTDAWGAARSVLSGDAEAIEGTGADFAVVPSGAYPALEDGLAELGFSRVHDDGAFEVYARKAAP